MASFENFHTCPYTTLKPASERLLASSVFAEWNYDTAYLNAILKSDIANARSIDFNAISKACEDALVNTFSGPSDTGVASPSVQQTMFLMGEALLQASPCLSNVLMKMPNIHNIPFPLENYGVSNADHTGHPDMYYAISEPFGLIQVRSYIFIIS